MHVELTKLMLPAKRGTNIRGITTNGSFKYKMAHSLFIFTRINYLFFFGN